MQQRNIISIEAGHNPRELGNSVIETDRKRSVGVYDKVRKGKDGSTPEEEVAVLRNTKPE